MTISSKRVFNLASLARLSSSAPALSASVSTAKKLEPRTHQQFCRRQIAQSPGSPAARGYLRFARRITLNALLEVMVLLALLVPAYSQQEVDPTWYDPWATPNPAVVKKPQPPPADHKKRREIKAAASTGQLQARSQLHAVGAGSKHSNLDPERQRPRRHEHSGVGGAQ